MANTCSLCEQSDTWGAVCPKLLAREDERVANGTFDPDAENDTRHVFA